MTNFNIRRFARTARWQCRMSLKSVLSGAAGLSFGYLGIMFGWLYPILKGDKLLGYGDLKHTVEVCSLVYLILIVVSGVWIFADMKTKEQRIKVKMLPATDVEKYLVRWLGVTLGTMVVGIMAYCVADALRMVTCLVTGVDSLGCTITDFLKMFFLNDNGNTIVISEHSAYTAGTDYAVVGWVIWAQSFYVLGGTLLRRYQFVITTLVHILLFLGMAAVVAWLPVDVDRAVADSGNDGAFYAAGVALCLVAVVNWWLSYKIFKRMQVINNKWINL